jgi:signal transduction histidine kinase
VVHSIRFRLVLWFLLILTLILAIYSALLFYAQVRSLRAETLNRLESRYESLERLVRTGVDSTPEADPQRLGPNDELILLRGDGTVAYISGPLSEPPALDFSRVEANQGEHAVQYRTIVGAHDIDMYAFLIVPAASTIGTLDGFVILGTPIDPRGELKRLLLTVFMLTGLMLVLAAAGGFWLADRAMRPVKTIAEKARLIGETDLSQRFAMQRRDEIGQLAESFDAMLGRLEAAFARQRQFTADASHELRTPLTIVNLEASRALAAPRASGEYRRALEVIRSENQLMSRLVNDLLTLARLDAGREPLNRQPLDLADLAVDVIERLGPLASRMEVQLVAGDLPEAPVLGDRESLIRLLSNLVENGIKYTASNQPGSPRQVILETGASPKESWAWARVTDSGPGISSENQQHLFDRFYRADKSRARTGSVDEDDVPFPSGSGLGLAIVQGIAQLHGGRVEVTSQVKRGSTFELKLPLLPNP